MFLHWQISPLLARPLCRIKSCLENDNLPSVQTFACTFTCYVIWVQQMTGPNLADPIGSSVKSAFGSVTAGEGLVHGETPLLHQILFLATHCTIKVHKGLVQRLMEFPMDR